MMWFKQLLAARSMTIQQAVDILFDQTESAQLNGMNPDQLQAFVRKRRGQLAKQFHPDHARDKQQREEFTKKMQEINNAVDAISLSGWRIPGRGYVEDMNERVYREDMAAQSRWNTNQTIQYGWETDKEFEVRKFLEKRNIKNGWDPDIRGSHNVGRSRKDQNYCKKEIYDYSVRFGEVTNMTFVAFDGTFFRLILTVKSNLSGTEFAAEVMEEWNESRGYESKAIFLMMNQELILLRLNGVNVAKRNITFKSERWFGYDEGNESTYNIMNDQKIIEKIKAYVRRG